MTNFGTSLEPYISLGLEPYRGGSGNEPYRSGVRVEPYRNGVVIEPYRGGASTEPYPPASDNGALLSDALNISASAVVRLDDKLAGAAVKELGDTLMRREAWVRATLAQAELLGPLSFENDALWLMPTVGKSGALRGGAKSLLALKGPDDALLLKQVGLVVNRKDERPDRKAEILVQISRFWPFWTAVTGLSATATPRCFELLSIAAELSPAIGQSFKQHVNCKRPSEMSPQVQPMIETPGHASFPSGHATGAWLFVRIASTLLDLDPADGRLKQLERLASRIADNRVVAGVHYPMDSEAGHVLGDVLAQYFIARCHGEDIEAGRSHTAGSPAREEPNADKPLAASVPRSDILNKLWNAARDELGLQRSEPVAKRAAARRSAKAKP